MLAVRIQHEIDHLDGRLFVDYLSSTKRQMIRKKLLKLKSKGSDTLCESFLLEPHHFPPVISEALIHSYYAAAATCFRPSWEARRLFQCQ